MPFNRRRFLSGTALAAWLWARCGTLGAAMIRAPQPAGPALTPSQRRTLGAFVDTLIPEDEIGPGAAEWQVPRAIEANALAGPAHFLRLLQEGCSWLDRQARALETEGFAELGEQEREEVIRRAEEAHKGSAQRLFFLIIRRDAFLVYYSRSEVWKTLGYRGPPQPRGFVDYTDPPGTQVDAGLGV